MKQREEELKDFRIYIVDNEFAILSYKDEEFIVRILSVNHNFYNMKKFKTLKGAKKYICFLKNNK